MREFSAGYTFLILDSLTYPESMFPECSHLPTPLDVATPYYVVGSVTGDNMI